MMSETLQYGSMGNSS